MSGKPEIISEQKDGGFCKGKRLVVQAWV